MKKLYNTPHIEMTKLLLANIAATSVPVSGETDDEARSNKYWGKAPWEGEDDEEQETDSWF